VGGGILSLSVSPQRADADVGPSTPASSLFQKNSENIIQAELPLALPLFNVGVEIGQLAFVIQILLLERSFRLLEFHWPRMVARLPGYLVGTLGAYWTIQRLVILLRGFA